MVAWFKHDIPAWMDGTEKLSDGAYRAYHVVCQLIYLSEGPITLNEHGIAGRCRQSVRAFRKNLKELINAGKLTLENGRLHNSRAGKELEKVDDNRMNAAKGGENSGKSRNATRKPLKSNDADEATLQEDRSLKTRLDETRVAAPMSADEFAKFESAVHAELPAEVTWRIRRCYDYAPLIDCMTAGADLRRDVLPSIRECSLRKQKEGGSIGTWSFFVSAIMDRAKARGALRSLAKSREIPWDMHAANWAKGVAEKFPSWPPGLGPEPGYTGCKCPPEVLRKHGVDPETGGLLKSKVPA